jgi:hypothetical protein
VSAFSNFSLYGFYLLFITAFFLSYRRSDLQTRRVVQAYLGAEILGSGIIVRSLKMFLGRARPDAGILIPYRSFWIASSVVAVLASISRMRMNELAVGRDRPVNLRFA